MIRTYIILTFNSIILIWGQLFNFQIKLFNNLLTESNISFDKNFLGQ